MLYAGGCLFMPSLLPALSADIAHSAAHVITNFFSFFLLFFFFFIFDDYVLALSGFNSRMP
jgi:hypothetical protein